MGNAIFSFGFARVTEVRHIYKEAINRFWSRIFYSKTIKIQIKVMNILIVVSNISSKVLANKTGAFTLHDIETHNYKMGTEPNGICVAVSLYAI